MTVGMTLALTFVSGALYESLCVAWVRACQRDATTRAVALAALVAAVQRTGFGESLTGTWPAVAWVAGCAAGTWVTMRWQRHA